MQDSDEQINKNEIIPDRIDFPFDVKEAIIKQPKLKNIDYQEMIKILFETRGLK